VHKFATLLSSRKDGGYEPLPGCGTRHSIRRGLAVVVIAVVICDQLVLPSSIIKKTESLKKLKRK